MKRFTLTKISSALILSAALATPVFATTKITNVKDAPTGAASIMVLKSDGTCDSSSNCNGITNSLKFLIVDFRGDDHNSAPYTYFYTTQTNYNKIFGDNSVLIVDASKTTVASFESFLKTKLAGPLQGLIQFIWFESNHGYKTDSGTNIYWGCGSGSCKQIMSFKDLDATAINDNPQNPFSMAWFDACYTHVPTDGISNPVDGTAAGWIKTYTKNTPNAYACGFTSYTNGFDAAYSSCIFNDAITKNYITKVSPQITPTNYQSLVSACHKDPGSSSIGSIAFAAPYCTSGNISQLNNGVVTYARMVNTMTGNATLIREDQSSQPITVAPAGIQNPTIEPGSKINSLFVASELQGAIKNNTLAKLIGTVVVKDSKNQTAYCQDTNEISPPVKFDSQFNGFNFNLGEDANGPYCFVDYAYIDGSSTTGTKQTKMKVTIKRFKKQTEKLSKKFKVRRVK